MWQDEPESLVPVYVVIGAFLFLQVLIMYTAFFLMRMLTYMSHKLTPTLPEHDDAHDEKATPKDKGAKHQVALVEPA